METKIVKTENFIVDNSQMITFENRMETFEMVWAADKLPTAEQLAKCGFYVGNTPNKTWCFYCGRTKGDWNAYDNPWVEHAILSSGCPFLQLHRSTQTSFHWNSPASINEPSTLFQSCRVR